MRASQREINRLTMELEKAQRSGGKLSKSLDDNDSRLTKFGKNLMQGKDALVGYAAAAAGVFYAIDRAAARVRDFADATANLTYDLGQLASAVDHGATQFELAGAAADIQATSLNLSQQQVNELFAAVDKTAAAHKREFIPALEATTKAINKGNVDKLKALGLQVDMKSALDREATALGKTTKELTAAERQTVAFNEVMRAMNKELATQTKEADGLAFTWERWSNKQIDNADSIGQSLNSIGDSIARIGGAMSDAEEESDSFWDSMIDDGLLRYVSIGSLDGIRRGWADVAGAIGFATDQVVAFKAESGVGESLRKGVNAINEARNAEAEAYNAFVQGMHADAWLAESRRLDAVSTEIIKKEEARKKRRGGKRDNRSELERQLEAFQPMSGSDDPTGELLGRGTLVDPFEGGADREYLDRIVEVERLKNDAVLAERMRALEEERAMGVDPFDQIEREQEALLAHNDFLYEATADDIQRLQLLNDRRQITHEAHLRRIAKEREAEKRRLADMMAWTNASAGLLGYQTQTAQLAADLGIKNEERRAKFMNRARGIESLGIAALEAVKAAAAIAAFNYPEAALHIAAAAVGTAQGIALLSGRLDQRAGGGASSGITGASFGSGGGASGFGAAANGPPGVSGGRRSEGLTEQINSDVPPSPNPQAPTTASAQQQSSNTGGFVNNGTINTYGVPPAEFIDLVTRGQKEQGRNHRRAS